MQTHKQAKQFIPVVKKLFTKQKVILEKKDLSVKIEYKPFYFKYQGLNFKSDIPVNMPMTIKDFLNHFGRDRSVGLENMNPRSFKDFDIARNDEYLPLDIPMVDMNTQMKDLNPVSVYESKLTYNNIHFRGIKHLKYPMETHNLKLQEFFNNFLEEASIDKTKIVTDDIVTLLKSLNNIKNNESKIAMLVASLINKLNHYGKEAAITFHSNRSIEMENRTTENNIYLIKNAKMNNHIPVTIAVGEENELNHAIVGNFSTLRNISNKFGTLTNFGVVTNLTKWKFNLYLKPQGNKVEKEEHFLTSLPYKLSITDSHIGVDSYSVLLKIIDGITRQDPKQYLNFNQ